MKPSMNPCECSQQVSAYHDGELPSEARAVLEMHLPQCPPCTEELDSLRQLTALVGDVVQLDAKRMAAAAHLPASSLSLLHGEVDRWGRERGDGRLLRIARVLTGLAACLLLGAGIWLFGPHPTTHATAAVAVHSKPWEQVAITLQTEISSTGGIDLATDWVVADATMPGTVE